MKQETDDETELRQYLLGELPREESAQVEERLFLDGDYFRRLQAAADDLVDDYVYEELSAADRGRFETHFLSQPGRREDLKIARALQMYISAEADTSSAAAELPRTLPPPRAAFFPSLRALNPLARLSLAAAAVIIVALGVWLLLRAGRGREQSPPMQAQQPAPATPRREELPTNGGPVVSPSPEPERRADRGNQEPAPEEKRADNGKGQEAPRPPGPTPPGDAPARTTLAVLLLPGGGVRGGGGEGNKVALARGVRAVTLQMPLTEAGDYRDYRATLRAGGRAVLTKSGLKPAPVEGVDVISLTVPAGLLRPGQDYQLKLSGTTAANESRDIAAYAFRVEAP